MSQPILKRADTSAESDNILTVSGELDFEHPYTELRMPDGQTLRVPTALLHQPSIPYPAPLPREQFRGALASEAPGEGGASHEVVVPVVEEQLVVGKRVVATGKVRLEKTVEEYQEALDEPLAVRTFDVERVILNRPVEAAPGVRHEGDTTIYPIVEEQLILTRQLILKEEVHVTKRETERRDTQVVTLRRERLRVERE